MFQYLYTPKYHIKYLQISPPQQGCEAMFSMIMFSSLIQPLVSIFLFYDWCIYWHILCHRTKSESLLNLTVNHRPNFRHPTKYPSEIPSEGKETRCAKMLTHFYVLGLIPPPLYWSGCCYQKMNGGNTVKTGKNWPDEIFKLYNHHISAYQHLIDYVHKIFISAGLLNSVYFRLRIFEE